MEYLRKNLETVDEIKQEFPLPVLGEIPRLPRNKESWTFVDQDPISTYAEAFRKLRTNIELSTKKNPLNTILVSSASEGDGKTSTAINLAIAYSYLGKKVVLIDADIRRHRLSQALELNHEPGLTELLSGEMTLEDVIQHWQTYLAEQPQESYLPFPVENSLKIRWSC